MSDFLQTGARWLRSQLKAKASRTVTYRRGAQTVEISATVGSTLLKLSDEVGGVVMERTDRDYIFSAEDLILGGSVTTPAKGDQIDDDNEGDDVTYTYEVRAPGDEQPWRWADPHHAMIRAHTKLVSRA